MHAAPVQRTILSTRRIMVPPLTLCAYMKKGPNLRWSLIQCSGGDEGDRTPDLLTASQALSQLSYAPVRRSTIRELGRRCKDNFGKTFGGGPPGAAMPDPTRGARPAGGGRAAARRRLPRQNAACRVTVAAPHRPSALTRTHFRNRARPVGAAPRQNHALLRGSGGLPRPCRKSSKQNRR